MLKPKPKFVTPERVSRPEFDRILGNLVKAEPIKRKDARIGHAKTEGKIIPSKPQQ